MKKIICLIIVLISFSCSKEKKVTKIMTYNIRYDNPGDGENQWTKRKGFLASQIIFFEPDIFGIQEGLKHQVDYLDTKLSNYDYVGIGRDDGKTKGEYSAIFYNKYKFAIIEASTFWLSNTPNKISVGWDAAMERICTYALFENKNTKKRFFVFNTHFDHIGTVARLKSSELILEKIKELNENSLPVVLMGDFNLKPLSEPIKYLSGILNDTKSVSSVVSFGPEGTFNGFKFNKPVMDRIDYIFTSKNNIEVKKYAVLSDSKNCKYPSDHLPILVELTMK